MFNAQVHVADLVAVGAALIAAVAILAALAKDRALRKKEIVDRVRQSAALVIAKLDRWKQVALQAFGPTTSGGDRGRCAHRSALRPDNDARLLLEASGSLRPH
jgi:asparagine synthetase A